MNPSSLSGIVADGRERFTGTEEYYARECKARLAVQDAFAPRLAAARTVFETWSLLWERRRETRRALRKLGPSPDACFVASPDSTRFG